MKHVTLYLILLFFFCTTMYSEDLHIKMSAYLDTYYAIDNDDNFDALSQKTRPFSYINKQKDEFRLNVAQIQGVIDYNKQVRGIVTFHAGDLLHTGWEDLGANDPTLQQANAGFMAFENFWIDAGYFLTHIGGELLLPKDNWLSSHSLVTNFEPFYQAGFRFSYELPNITAQIHIINGNGIFEDNNYNKSVGLYFAYIFNEKWSVSYANIFGNEEAGNPQNSRLLMFHNLDINYNQSPDFRIKGQVDFANLAEKDTIKTQSYCGVSIEAQYCFTKVISASLRSSYIMTDNFLFINAENGYEVACGLQYKPFQPIYVMLEGRMLTFDKNYTPFLVDGRNDSSRLELMLNFGVLLE